VFDEIYPPSVRRASSIHWTPVDVAMRATKLLAVEPGATILDVGSGVGKFCIVAAALVAGLKVRGVEHRAHFIDIAREAATKVGVEVDFNHGTLDAQDPSTVDGIYLFNPFAENLSAVDDRLDDTVELSEDRYWKDVEVTERFLRAARTGTRVVTYCGWGGSMPPEYELARRETRSGNIELWIKSGYSARPTSGTVKREAPIGPNTLQELRDRTSAAGVALVWDGTDTSEPST
jgi:SAM-dependent methyltransferase